MIIFIIQYISDNFVCRRKTVNKHSDARQHWMIDSNQSKTIMNDRTSARWENLNITINFYNMLSWVHASKVIQ